VQSRALVGRLKRGDPGLIPSYAARVLSLVQQGQWHGFFGADVTLVPVPGSSPLVRGGLWVPLLVARELHAAGLCRDVSPLVTRIGAVAKSAYQPAAQRPTVQQNYDSLNAQVLAPAPTRIVLVDDVITMGSTMLAAARRVAEAYPQAEVRGFALVRTMSGVDVPVIVEPCTGTIEARRDRAVRRP
jgi:hypothetical protein